MSHHPHKNSTYRVAEPVNDKLSIHRLFDYQFSGYNSIDSQSLFNVWLLKPGEDSTDGMAEPVNDKLSLNRLFDYQLSGYQSNR